VKLLLFPWNNFIEMLEFPLVSIVTPSFNQAQFLEETIQSVLQQDYPYIEYLIIDGGSTDGSVDIIQKYEKHITYWVSEPDKGQSHAINKGFARATGSIFAWLNADDFLVPSAVHIAIYFLSTMREIGLVYGDRLEIDTKGNITGILKCPSHDPKMFRKNITLPQETVFFRRKIFESVGRLDEELHFAMDFDLWCKMSKITNFFHIPVFIGYFRRHESSKSVLFHHTSADVASQYLKEHNTVFSRHFKTGLPSSFQMKWYNYIRKFRLLLELRSKTRKEIIQRIQQVTSGKLNLNDFKKTNK
jgi:glycosyltransferase involved in cell wall biosynthesis